MTARYSFPALLATLASAALLAVAPSAQPTFISTAGGTAGDEGRAVASDAAGNVYVTGPFRGTIDLDLTDGEDAADTYSSAGGSDVFVASYTPSGTYRWGFALGAASNDVGSGIATDGTRVYVSGDFQRAIDFDPGSGEATLNRGDLTGFVAAYDAATGAFSWVQATTSSSGFVSRVATDGMRVYGLGNTASTVVLTAFEPATGDRVWGRTIEEGSNGEIAPGDVATDGTRVYVAGRFERRVNFGGSGGSGERVSAGATDAFLVAFDAATGDFAWVNAVGSAGATSDDAGRGVAAGGGRVYLTGEFEGTADFEDGEGTQSVTSAGGFDAFVAAYDAATGAYRWAGALGGPGSDFGLGIAADGGRVVVSGSFSGTADFDPGAESQERVSAGDEDVFVAAYDAASGAYATAAAFGGPERDRGLGVAAQGGRVYAAGFFRGTADLDPSGATDSRTSAGDSDVFVTAFPSVMALPAEDAGPEAAFSLSAPYPNPASETARLSLTVGAAQHVHAAAFDALGRRVGVLFDGPVSEGVSLSLDVGGLPAGVYLVRVRGEAFAGTRRVTVAR